MPKRLPSRLPSRLPGLALIASTIAAFAAVTSPGCASTERVDDQDRGATLEVENRTSDDVYVSVRGRNEATVRSGTRVRVHALLAGKADIDARAVRGGAGAFIATTTVDLVRGKTSIWSVLPDAAGGAPLPEVPGLGALRIQNPTRKDVSITLGGVRVGRVFAGGERVFADLPAGTAHVSARPDDRTAPTETDVALVADTEATWRYGQVGAELNVVNQTDEAINVTIDGEARARVAPGTTWTSLEAPGLRVLQARSEPSRRPYETVASLTVDAPATWTVTAGQASLVVDNATGEALALQVPGRPPTTVAPNDKARFEDLPSGGVDVSATGVTSHLVYAVRLELLPAQVATWVAGPIKGSIRVENRTRRPMRIYSALGDKEKDLGTVAPNAVVLLRDLPRSTVALSAIATGVARRSSTTIDLSETPAATWVLAASTGAVRVTNERDEDVDTYVDSLRVGEVVAHGERTFTGVEVGERLVESVGKKSGVALRERPTVSEDVLANVVVPDTMAWVVVDNVSGEAVETRGFLADQASSIAAGASIRFRVPAGTLRLLVVGRDSGLAYSHGLDVKAGESAAWSVALEPGRMLVWSRLDESAALTIDGHTQGVIAPDETVVVEDVAPGRHRVQLVGLRSSGVRVEDVVASPGADTKVTFATESGILLVENRSQEKVAVSIDGALYGDALGGAVHAFGKVQPGKREVELWFPVSRRTQRVTLDIREGQRARIVAEAPMGLLVVDNSSRQDVRVSVDGQPIAVVGADAGPTLVNAPSGSRHVQIERLADHSQIGFQLNLRADSAFHLPVPPKTVRLVVVNRADVKLTLFAGEHEIGTVGERASMMFDELPDGDAHLFAKDAAGHVTHEEQRRLHAGETATWVLD